MPISPPSDLKSIVCVHVYMALIPPILFSLCFQTTFSFVCYICVYVSIIPLSSTLLPAPPLPRFSLLLLEFSEIYFEDFSAIYYPNASTVSESIDRYISVHELMSGLLIVECVMYMFHISHTCINTHTYAHAQKAKG